MNEEGRQPSLAESVRKRGEGEREKDEARGRDCDEVVKSVGRLKIIQGSALRADALAALTCPHLSARLCPCNAAISRRAPPPPPLTTEEYGGAEAVLYGIGYPLGTFRRSYGTLKTGHIARQSQHTSTATYLFTRLPINARDFMIK